MLTTLNPDRPASENSEERKTGSWLDSRDESSVNHNIVHAVIYTWSRAGSTSSQ